MIHRIIHEIEQNTETAVEAWRRRAEDPFASEEDLRRQLRYTATMVEKLMVVVRRQEEMVYTLRIGFWIMFAFAFVVSCMMLFYDGAI